MPEIDRPKPFSFAALDMKSKLESGTYDGRLAELQDKLIAIEQAYLGSKESAVIVFEGWDAAGKGGAIRRISNVLDPRGFKVWPIAAPSPDDLKRHYLARFWERLPKTGEIAVFDRSWYGRVLVERVEGFAPKADWKRAYDEINGFETTLADAGIRIVKIFLAITREEQLERFVKRMDDPLKRWKLSAEDFRNRGKWDDYIEAAEEMVAKTSTPSASWHVIPSNSKKYSRITALQAIVDRLSDSVDLTPRPLPPEVAQAARQAVEAEGKKD
jgi:polyphosphate kinase 2 (PPK2 family)